MDDPDSTLKFEHPKWKSNLVENLTVLFQKGELCDLHIMCRDHRDINISFACHACILASASPVVRNLLVKNDIFAAWTKLAIKSYGISAREWEYILKYVYTGSVNIQEPHIYAVWKAALYLQIDILVTVLATCIHKYHYAGAERDRIPHLKVCPFDPNSTKTQDTSHVSGIISTKTSRYKRLNFLDFMSSTKQASDQRKSMNFQSDKFSTSFKCDHNKRSDTSTISKHQNSHKTVYEISDGEEYVDLQKPIHQNVKQNSTSQTMYNKFDNGEPSATKKRKMYTPRRVHSNDRHNKEVTINTHQVYGEQSNATTYEKEADKQKDDLSSYYEYIQDSFDFHLNPSNEVFSPHKMDNSNDNVPTHEPLVIAPILNESVAGENHLRDDSSTSHCKTNIKEEKHVDEETYYNRMINPKCKNSDSSQKSVLYDLLHTPTRSSDTESSSVLKSLLVSSCNNYRTPEKPHHTTKLQESTHYKDSSEEDDQDFNYLIDVHTVNDKKFDPDYKPSVKSKRKQKSECRVVNKPTEKQANIISTKNNTKLSANHPSVIRGEPYSASSILLSMIKDAGAKKSSNDVTTVPAPTLKSVQPINLVKGECHPATDQSNEDSPLNTAKGILRNLLKERGLCEDKSSEVNQKVPATSVISDSRIKASDHSPSPDTLPFSNVLQNMALAYNSATRASESSLLKNMLEDTEIKKDEKLCNVTDNNFSSSHGPHNLAVIANEKTNGQDNAIDDCEQPSQLKNLLTIPSDNQLKITIGSNDLEPNISEISSASSKNVSSEKTKSDQNIDFAESDNDMSQGLKLTICKTACAFKVKEEPFSPDTCRNSHYNQISKDISPLAEIPTKENNLLSELDKEFENSNTFEKAESNRVVNDCVESGPCEVTNINRTHNTLESSLSGSNKIDPKNISFGFETKNKTETIDKLQVETKNDNSDQSECGDVEVAHFSGLQSADSAASISDTEVAEDFSTF